MTVLGLLLLAAVSWVIALGETRWVDPNIETKSLKALRDRVEAEILKRNGT